MSPCHPASCRPGVRRCGWAPVPSSVLLGLVQPPGKKPMAAADRACGARLEDGVQASSAEKGGPRKAVRTAAVRAAVVRAAVAQTGTSARQGSSPQKGPAPQKGPRRTEQRARGRVELDPARRAAFDVLRAVSEQDAYANLALPALLTERGISSRDAAFATELTYGTCRTSGLLDAVTRRGGPPGRSDRPGAAGSLRLGTYQLLRTNAADHAAVSTTVEQAGGVEFDTARADSSTACYARSPTATNSLGRSRAGTGGGDRPGRSHRVRARPPALDRPSASPTRSAPTPVNSTPHWPPTTPGPGCTWHASARRAERGRSAEEVDGTVGRLSPYAVYLDSGDPGRLDAIRGNKALVQDGAAQLGGPGADAGPAEGEDGGRWLDLCAVLGGKTALLGAIAAQQGATVTAIEPNERRAEMVEHNTRGLPVEVLRRLAGQRSLPHGEFRPGPRRRPRAPDWVRCAGCPEARWRRTPADVPALAKLQRTAGRRDRADPPRRGGGPGHLLTASVRDRRGDLRRVAPPPVTALDTRALFSPAENPAPGRMSSCGRIGTAPMRCSRWHCARTAELRCQPCRHRSTR